MRDTDGEILTNARKALFVLALSINGRLIHNAAAFVPSINSSVKCYSRMMPGHL